MKKVVAVVLVAIVIMVAIFGKMNREAQTAGVKNGKPTIKIGVNLPLTGAMAFAGENMQKSLAMALENIKSNKILSLIMNS